MAYPVSVTVEPQVEQRNRLTVAFRLILAIPHAILVGPILGAYKAGNSAGLLGVVAYFLAIINWFAILITGEAIPTIRDFALYYLRWRTRAMAYEAILVDPYPPFGDGSYPTAIDVAEASRPRDRVSVAFRLILIIPHAVVLFVSPSRVVRDQRHRLVRDSLHRVVSGGRPAVRGRRHALDASRGSVHAPADRRISAVRHRVGARCSGRS